MVACQPVPGRSAVAGDSISYLVKQDGGAWTNGADAYVFPGAKAGDILPLVQDAVADPATSMACLAIEFGPNEVGDGVISAKEAADIASMVFAPDKTARDVVTLPYWSGDTVAQQAAMVQWRTDLTALATARQKQGSPTVVIDLRTSMQGHPEYLQADGVHPTPEGAEVLDRLYQVGCT